MSIIALALAAACSSSSGAKKPDAAVDAFPSTCGEPGDTGNEVGVGKFCQSLEDCFNNGSATLCSVLGDNTTHFCTLMCTCAAGSNATCTDSVCGTNTSCTCNDSNQCGCTPNSCLN